MDAVDTAFISSSSSSSNRSHFKESKFKKSDSSVIKLVTSINRRCPIMFTPLPRGRCSIWKYRRPGGTTVAFDVNTLTDYMLQSGNFCDPETRLPFTDVDLKAIDIASLNAAKKSGIAKQSVFAARNAPDLYTEMRFQRDALKV